MADTNMPSKEAREAAAFIVDGFAMSRAVRVEQVARALDAFAAPYKAQLEMSERQRADLLRTADFRQGCNRDANEAASRAHAAEAERDALAAQVAALRMALSELVLESSKADGMVSALLHCVSIGQPLYEEWLQTFSDQRRAAWNRAEIARTALTDTPAAADNFRRETEARGMEMAAAILDIRFGHNLGANIIRYTAARRRAGTTMDTLNAAVEAGEAGQPEDSEGETK